MSRALLVATALFLFASTAHAEDPLNSQARREYDAGMKLYNLNEHSQALEHFKAAYLVKADPAFLFNIAQCYRQLHRYGEAANFYRSYRREDPTRAAKSNVDKLIAEMERALDEQRAKAPPTGTEPPREEKKADAPPVAPVTNVQQVVLPPLPQADREGGRRRATGIAALTLGAVGAVLVSVGGGMFGYANSLQTAPTLAEELELPSQRQNARVAGGVLAGIGGLALVGSAVSFGLWLRYHTVSVALVPSSSSGGAMLSLRGIAW